MKIGITSLILSLMLLGCDSGDKEIIVVPKNYRGYVVIIYNQKNDVSKYENNKRVYEIPSNGILKTLFKGNYGLREFTEYYFEKIDPENKFPSYVEFKKIPPDTVVGLMGANGNANKDYEAKQTVEYSLFYVGTRGDIEKAMKQAEKLDIVSLAE
jgi:hypothetical protein